MAINLKQLHNDTLNDIQEVYNEYLQLKKDKAEEILRHQRNINSFNFNLRYYFKILNALKSELNDINDQLAFYKRWYHNQVTFKLD